MPPPLVSWFLEHVVNEYSQNISNGEISIPVIKTETQKLIEPRVNVVADVSEHACLQNIQGERNVAKDKERLVGDEVSKKTVGFQGTEPNETCHQGKEHSVACPEVQYRWHRLNGDEDKQQDCQSHYHAKAMVLNKVWQRRPL